MTSLKAKMKRAEKVCEDAHERLRDAKDAWLEHMTRAS